MKIIIKNSKLVFQKYKLDRDVIIPDMAALRAPVDKLESLVDSSYWPIPTYGDMLFEA